MLKLRHRILPIMFKDITHVPEMDENLKVILASVTYLEVSDKDFWRKLKKALSKHHKQPHTCERSISESTEQTQVSDSVTMETEVTQVCDSITSI